MSRPTMAISTAVFLWCAVAFQGAWSAAQAATGQATPSIGTQASESITAAAAALGKTGTLKTTTDGSLVFDHTLLVKGTSASEERSKQLDAFYAKVQVGEAKSGTPVFVEVGADKNTQLSSSMLDEIAAIVGKNSQEIQSCAAGRECVRMCVRDGREQCCEWRCQK